MLEIVEFNLDGLLSALGLLLHELVPRRPRDADCTCLAPGPRPPYVMRRLDPRIHRKINVFRKIDGRVKPGHDT